MKRKERTVIGVRPYSYAVFELMVNGLPTIAVGSQTRVVWRIDQNREIPVAQVYGHKYNSGLRPDKIIITGSKEALEKIVADARSPKLEIEPE